MFNVCINLKPHYIDVPRRILILLVQFVKHGMLSKPVCEFEAFTSDL